MNMKKVAATMMVCFLSVGVGTSCAEGGNRKEVDRLWKERICVQEAHTLGIPLIGICDTNCDPEELDYVIPGNDDAIRAVKLIVSKMADAVIEAKQGAEEEVTAEEASEETVEE